MVAKYKTFGAFGDALKKKIEEMASRAVLNLIALKAKDIIYKRVKSGFGVDPGSLRKERLKPLSAGYVKFRAGNFSYDKKSRGQSRTVNRGAPRLGTFGSPTKSNLTLSGEMLESIAVKFTRGGVTLYFPDTPHPVHKHVTIRELAQYVEDQGRPFFYLTEDERRILVSDLSKMLRKLAGSLK